MLPLSCDRKDFNYGLKNNISNFSEINTNTQAYIHTSTTPRERETRNCNEEMSLENRIIDGICKSKGEIYFLIYHRSILMNKN